MKAQHIFIIFLLFSIGVNCYQYFSEQQLKSNEEYLQSRYQVKDQDVRTLLGIAAPHLSNLSLTGLTSHLDASGIMYRKDVYPQAPEFVYILVGELTFRFNQQGVFVSVVQSKL